MKSPLAKLVVGIALLTAACSDKSAKARASADSDLARDLALASSQTAAPAALQDTAVAPAPVQASAPKKDVPAPVKTRAIPKPTPRPQTVAQAPAPQAPVVVPQAIVPAAAPAPAAIRGEIAAGSAGGLTTAAKVCTSSNLPGDKLVATLNIAMTGSNGFDLPAGSAVVLEVATVNHGETADGAQITFRVRSIVVNDKTYNVSADVLPSGTLEKSKVAGVDPNADKKKVIGGAIAGAILGQMIGHNTKGTVIGAAAGAAAGAAVAKNGERWEACLPAGSQVTLKLNAPLVLS